MFRRTLTALLLATTLLSCAPHHRKFQKPVVNCDGNPITITNEETHYPSGTRVFVTTEYSWIKTEYNNQCKPRSQRKTSYYPNSRMPYTRMIYYIYGEDGGLALRLTDKDNDGSLDTVLNRGFLYNDETDSDRRIRDFFEPALNSARQNSDLEWKNLSFDL